MPNVISKEAHLYRVLSQSPWHGPTPLPADKSPAHMGTYTVHTNSLK